MIISKIEVVGDSGDTFAVTVDPVTKAVRCECPAYRYAKNKGVALCKHIRFVAAIVSD